MDKDKLTNEEPNASEAGQHDQHSDQADTPDNGDGKKPRTFTQEEVNEIVKERLARAKRGDDLQERESELDARETSLSEREAKLSQRENKLLAQAELTRLELGDEYLQMIDLTSADTVQDSINKIQAIRDIAKAENREKLPPIVRPQGNRNTADHSDLRSAFFPEK